jgi:CO/xanthine dehydrogenase FAD-binding subunit
MAVSGICAFPFRSVELESELNSDKSFEERIANAFRYLPAPVLDDVEGSAGYREFVLLNTLKDTLTHFAGVK